MIVQIIFSQAFVRCVTQNELTLMLLVANLANTKRCKKPDKLLKPWQMGTHLSVLGESFSNEYQDARVSMFFQESCIRLLLMKVVSALEGFRIKILLLNISICMVAGPTPEPDSDSPHS